MFIERIGLLFKKLCDNYKYYVYYYTCSAAVPWFFFAPLLAPAFGTTLLESRNYEVSFIDQSINYSFKRDSAPRVNIERIPFLYRYTAILFVYFILYRLPNSCRILLFFQTYRNFYMILNTTTAGRLD